MKCTTAPPPPCQEMRRLIERPASFDGMFKGFSAFLAQVNAPGLTFRGSPTQLSNASLSGYLVYSTASFTHATVSCRRRSLTHNNDSYSTISVFSHRRPLSKAWAFDGPATPLEDHAPPPLHFANSSRCRQTHSSTPYHQFFSFRPCSPLYIHLFLSFVRYY